MKRGSVNQAGKHLSRCCLLLALLLTALAPWGRAVRAAAHARVNDPEASRLLRVGAEAERTFYRITLDLNVDERSFSGTESVRWVNTDDNAAGTLYFHLYPNLRSAVQRSTAGAGATAAGGPASAPDEPRLDITSVRAAGTGLSLPFAIDDQATVLRVMLREPVAAGAATEIIIEFNGTVPEIDPEETGLLAHLVQQVGAVLRGEREVRRARDTSFRCRGVMLLGASYPILAARDGQEWQRKVEQTVGDAVYADVADYSVEIRAAEGVRLYTSGEEIVTEGSAQAGRGRVFTGERLRSFAVLAGRNLRAEEQAVGAVVVRSVFMEGHETVGRRVLGIGAEAVRAYAARFGELPFKTVTVAESPLVAGFGSVEFSSLSIIASAFYVDFDSPLMRNLPEIVREQRTSIEDSLEFAVANVVAHQWWGGAVGNDPARLPVLDEALANWSALLYYKEVHGEARATVALDDQLRGVYKIYRTFGGEDMEADRAARDYRNSFQYSAIVASKGALMFTALRRLMGDEKFFAALRSYYNANKFEVASLDDLRGAFIAEAPLQQRRTVARTFSRWLSSKRGDEDIAPPDPKLAEALGINPAQSKNDGGGGGNAFARLGKFFWQQMTRIR